MYTNAHVSWYSHRMHRCARTAILPVVLAPIVLAACAGASATTPTAAEPSLESALTAVVPTETPRHPTPMSATMANGCVIPCGTSSVTAGVWLVGTSDDPTYGYSEENPIRVASVPGYTEMIYLQGLWGPEGQPVSFERIGSCCSSPDRPGLLDTISVTYEGLEEPVVLYLDAYRSGPLLAPMGFRGVGPAQATPSRADSAH